MKKLNSEKINEKTEEIKYQEELAIKGDAEAQNIIAARLAKGYFVEKNEQGAFYWYSQAIKQGYVNAKWNAGLMLLQGEGGLPINLEVGITLIKDAANSGEVDACKFLSYCYLHGKYNIEKNIVLSELWKKQSESKEPPKYFSNPVDIEKYGIVIEKPSIKWPYGG
jgi:uncharacterized protein